MHIDEQYRLLFERNMAGVYRTTVDGEVLDCNDAFARILGYRSRDELMQLNASEFFCTPSDREAFVGRLIRENSLTNFECVLKRQDGAPVCILENVNLIADQGGDLNVLEGTVIDISEHKKSEEALRASEARSKAMLKALPDLMFRMDQDGTYTDYSAPSEDMLAAPPDQIIGKNVRDVGMPEHLVDSILAHRERALETGMMQSFEYELETPRGLGVFEARLVPCEDGEIVSIVRDVTRTRKLENHLRQSKKMEALGTLAGGIAHDFNNLLMGIQGNTSLMLLDAAPGHPFHERLDNIEQHVTRGAELTRQLLGFARGGKYVVKPANLNDIVTNSADMFGRTRKEISMTLTLQDDLLAAEVDQGQIEQVLLNIFVNAWQAMPDGGDIYIDTENVSVDSRNRFDCQEGRYVRISITDTGVGMDKKTLERIFEPFFSTKEMGHGTGLGLASAYGIIKNHGGFINVYSEIGSGTTVKIYLPASIKVARDEQIKPKSMVKGTETILFVDDEVTIVDVSREMLTEIGYTVLTANSGEEAIAVTKACGSEIDLVILDMIMPGLGGAETFAKLKKMKPDIKVLLCSGYSLNDKASKIIENGCRGFIQKPFDLAGLSSKIREILG